MEGITERFTVSISNRELVIGAIDAGRKKRLHLSPEEALTLLGILEKEEANLKQLAMEDIAYKTGLTRAKDSTPSDNPHEAGSKQWAAWNKGYSVKIRELKSKRKMLEHEYTGEILNVRVPSKFRDDFEYFCDELKKLVLEYPPGTFRNLKRIDLEWTEVNIKLAVKDDVPDDSSA